MTAVAPRESSRLDRGGDLSRKFLSGDYADGRYAGWSLDQRLTAFLRREGLSRVADDGDLYAALLDRVMADIPKVCSAKRYATGRGTEGDDAGRRTGSRRPAEP